MDFVFVIAFIFFGISLLCFVGISVFPVPVLKMRNFVLLKGLEI